VYRDKARVVSMVPYHTWRWSEAWRLKSVWKRRKAATSDSFSSCTCARRCALTFASYTAQKSMKGVKQR
jgi:hypothetical protein